MSLKTVNAWWIEFYISPTRSSSRVNRLNCVQPVLTPHLVLWGLMPVWRSQLNLPLTQMWVPVINTTEGHRICHSTQLYHLYYTVMSATKRRTKNIFFNDYCVFKLFVFSSSWSWLRWPLSVRSRRWTLLLFLASWLPKLRNSACPTRCLVSGSNLGVYSSI